MVDKVRWTILPISSLVWRTKERGKIFLSEFSFLIEFQTDDHINQTSNTNALNFQVLFDCLRNTNFL